MLKNPELPKEVTQLKTLLDLLQGRTYELKEEGIKFTPPKMASQLPVTGDEYIQSMMTKFEETGRAFSFEEMANLLISTQQSFLTVFKGLPGSGKTSSVIKLAQSHCLTGNDPDCDLESDSFLNVPVSRGWVSGRDFLGFYNSMKGVYQPAKTGMYQFLAQSNDEQHEQALRLILLDEANLSPIEHYWSDFLGMCDGEGRHRRICTGMQGEQRFLRAAENLRFIATINNDNTTEPLSPRLLDRVPVISMDILQSSNSNQFSSQLIDGAIPFTLLEKFYGNPLDLENDEPLDLTSFFSILEQRNNDLGLPVIVSKRKRQAMHSFYDVACRYMDPKLAADFALSQHALPLINGYGKQFKDRLSKLHDHATKNSLARTSEILEDIISNGNNYVGSYTFF